VPECNICGSEEMKKWSKKYTGADKDDKEYEYNYKGRESGERKKRGR
jgi:hypothetical protein